MNKEKDDNNIEIELNELPLSALVMIDRMLENTQSQKDPYPRILGDM